MTTDEVTKIALSFGFEIDFYDKEQRKIRFQGEKTFVDIWFGKKGITIGAYNPDDCLMQYKRNCGEEEIVEIFDHITK